MPARLDMQFGGEVLRRQWVSQKDFHKVVRRIEQAENQNRRVTAGTVMVELGLLDRGRESEALAQMGMRTVACERCGGERYALKDDPAAQCAFCGAFKAPEPGARPEAALPDTPMPAPPLAAKRSDFPSTRADPVDAGGVFGLDSGAGPSGAPAQAGRAARIRRRNLLRLALAVAAAFALGAAVARFWG